MNQKGVDLVDVEARQSVVDRLCHVAGLGPVVFNGVICGMHNICFGDDPDLLFE